MEIAMDMGLFRGLVTIAVFALFVGIVMKTYSSRQKAGFDRAAQMPLSDDPAPASDGSQEIEDKELER